jgi:L-alanine-DL-glutamate epimerase-like enolase superfamily enzyme
MAVHMAETPVGCMAAVHTAAASENFLALENHANDVPWWSSLVNGLPNPIVENGFIAVPDKPGLGIDSLNEEMIAAHIHPDHPGQWEETGTWDKDEVNDRLWS